MTGPEPLESAALPPDIRSGFASDINGLRIHLLEAGSEARGRPLVLLLHGFPELAYSWRKVMLPLAAAGFHVVAPDLRGYGAPPAGMRTMMGISLPFACSTPSGIPWVSPPHSAIAMSPWSPGTISERRSRRGARSCGPTCSIPSR